MSQKIIKVGNSYAITIPKNFISDVGLQYGDSVIVQCDVDTNTITVKPIDSSVKSTITPEFKKWMKDVNRKYKSALEELAKQ